MKSRLGTLLSVVLLMLGGVACEGPATPALIKDEPVCKDLVQAGEKLKGGLKQPVRLRILDGKEVIATVMLFGRPETANTPTRFLLPDSNDKYKLEWAQCAIERAPTKEDPRDKEAQKKSGSGASYDCGDAVVYTTIDHETKRGDASTHELAMPPPPVTDCW